MGDYNIDYWNKNERNSLDTIIVPYGLNTCSAQDETRINKSSRTDIEYINTDEPNFANSFVFETHFKTDHIASLFISSCNNKNRSQRKVFRTTNEIIIAATSKRLLNIRHDIICTPPDRN